MNANRGPINRSTLVAAIRQRLFELIVEQYNQKLLKLPAEQEMADRLAVSRNTLRQVLSQLESEGIITRRHGLGTFINPEAMSICVNLQELIDFSEIVHRSGHKPSQQIHALDEVLADQKLASLLHADVNQRIIRVEYWIYADQMPAIVVVGWCAADLFYSVPKREDWEKSSGFQVLLHHSGRMVKSDRVHIGSLSVKQMREELGHDTPLSCDSVLHMESVGFDQNGEPLILGSAYFDTSFIQFDLFRVNKE